MKKYIFLTLILSFILVSCNNETSLQEYYVEHQEDSKFLALDLPRSLFDPQASSLNAEQKATLESIKKVNLIAYPMNEENKASYEKEKSELLDILKNDKFQLLMKYGGDDRKAEVYYLGEDDAIDELIIFASDQEKGFGLARVLGDDMKPEALIKLMSSLKEEDLNIEGLQSFDVMFKD